MAEIKKAKKSTTEKTVKKNAPVKKKVVPAAKKVAKKVATKPATVKVSKIEEEKSFIADAAENIEAGMKVVGDKATEMASDFTRKTSRIAGSIFKKLKEGASDAYDAGSKMAGNITDKTTEYTDKHKNDVELKKINEELKTLYLKLGTIVNDKYKTLEGSREKLYGDDAVKDFLKTIKKKEDEIVKLGN